MYPRSIKVDSHGSDVGPDIFLVKDLEKHIGLICVLSSVSSGDLGCQKLE